MTRVIALAIIFDTDHNKILITKRENDPFIKNLTWCFPGATIHPGQNPDETLKMHMRLKIGVHLETKGVVYERIPNEEKDFELLYIYTEYIKGEPITSETFTEFKWIKPTEITNYFTTSIDNQLLEFLKTVEKSWE